MLQIYARQRYPQPVEYSRSGMLWKALSGTRSYRACSYTALQAQTDHRQLGIPRHTNNGIPGYDDTERLDGPWPDTSNALAY